jgi:hypothetical protein
MSGLICARNGGNAALPSGWKRLSELGSNQTVQITRPEDIDPAFYSRQGFQLKKLLQ